MIGEKICVYHEFVFRAMIVYAFYDIIHRTFTFIRPLQQIVTCVYRRLKHREVK